MNISNITNYKPKDFAELLGVSVKTLPQEELVQDIVSILHVFSCRLYGLRKYKKQIQEDKEIAEELQNGNKSDPGTKVQN